MDGTATGPHGWRHLRGWRRHAGLTLERAGEAEGVGHSAVSKWEKGQVTVTVARLESLARLYGAPHFTALFFAPNEREKADRFRRSWELLQRLEDADADAWLHMGERLAEGAGGRKSAGASKPARAA